MNIYIGSDHAGFEYKNLLVQYLNQKYNTTVTDVGCYTSESCDYPDFAQSVCRKINKHDGKGILICSTGQGMAMTANKYNNIRAAVVWNKDIAILARKHNDCNVICIGANFVNFETIKQCVDIFLTMDKSNIERYKRRVEKINQ